MNSQTQSRTFYLVPISDEAGLTTMALGLVRALQLTGLKVGFVKPIAQPGAGAEEDRSTHLAKVLCGAAPPAPIAFDHAANLVRRHQLAGLMEEVVVQVEALRGQFDALVVEGLIPSVEIQIATRLNIEMIRSLGADVIPVLSGKGKEIVELAATTGTAIEQYGDDGKRPVVGALVNFCDDAGAVALRRVGWLALGVGKTSVPILAAAPVNAALASPRMIDIAEHLGLDILQRGEIETARAENIVVAARSPEKLLAHLRPGTLLITPADRADVILATALIAERGMPLAGFVFTCGGVPAPEVMAVLSAPPLNRLPLLGSRDDTYTTATRLANLSRHVGRDDIERHNRAVAFIAERVDTAPLVKRIGAPSESFMPPPVFRHLLVERARSAAQRIVLPEGEEPRTIKAAAICAEKGIAHCILLGAKDKIQATAAAHGVDLPAALEIVDPAAVRGKYVQPMVEIRKNKGLTPLQAEVGLEDSVVVGTMMLAEGDVDGLVSGAVHTTADTVRPALQLIKTAPGSSIVSSVFFMLMPDQVMVYGDCAINPNPTAEELAQIAMQSADSAEAFGLEPRVAMISYSTGSSGAGEDVEKVRQATALVRERRPGLIIDGPIQYDAAAVQSVGHQKAPNSPLAGRANVFVFPDLNTGNTTYKAVQRSANVVSVGPMLQGLRKPVNDLSRGALVDDIVYTIALTAIQAQAGKRTPALSAKAAE
jgi:phosphate acetyltransferase